MEVSWFNRLREMVRSKAASWKNDMARQAIMDSLEECEEYGLEIRDRVFDEKGVELGPGTLYPTLRDLEREGYLESWESVPRPGRGGRPRRYYRIRKRLR